jgi:hypothetical protein
LPTVVGSQRPVYAQDDHQQHNQNPEYLTTDRLLLLKDVDDTLVAIL